jgi:DNA repair exonuclease SbcCD ATPase subunit
MLSLKFFKMKLTLKNFRCYTDRVFEFDEGLFLIEGRSGVGKSTILNAILFVLYGKGKKLQTHGKTSCSVQMEFEGLTIYRSKSPNRLVLTDENNKEIEDDAAQYIIDDKFGSCFDVTSYISQTALNSFILMSPTDKLEFLEKLTFKDINLKSIKDKNKVEINKRKDEMNMSMKG